MQAMEMLKTHPHVQGNTADALIHCIEECFSCAQTCTSCADACLGEDMVDNLKQCIRLNLDCADVCLATGALSSRRTGSNEQLLRQMLEACESACHLCATECEKHAGMHEHCRICAEACHSCEQACQRAMQDVQ